MYLIFLNEEYVKLCFVGTVQMGQSSSHDFVFYAPTVEAATAAALLRQHAKWANATFLIYRGASSDAELVKYVRPYADAVVMFLGTQPSAEAAGHLLYYVPTLKVISHTMTDDTKLPKAIEYTYDPKVTSLSYVVNTVITPFITERSVKLNTLKQLDAKEKFFAVTSSNGDSSAEVKVPDAPPVDTLIQLGFGQGKPWYVFMIDRFSRGVQGSTDSALIMNYLRKIVETAVDDASLTPRLIELLSKSQIELENLPQMEIYRGVVESLGKVYVDPKLYEQLASAVSCSIIETAGPVLSAGYQAVKGNEAEISRFNTAIQSAKVVPWALPASITKAKQHKIQLVTAALTDPRDAHRVALWCFKRFPQAELFDGVLTGEKDSYHYVHSGNGDLNVREVMLALGNSQGQTIVVKPNVDGKPAAL